MSMVNCFIFLLDYFIIFTFKPSAQPQWTSPLNLMTQAVDVARVQAQAAQTQAQSAAQTAQTAIQNMVPETPKPPTVTPAPATPAATS